MRDVISMFHRAACGATFCEALAHAFVEIFIGMDHCLVVGIFSCHAFERRGCRAVHHIVGYAVMFAMCCALYIVLCVSCCYADHDEWRCL